MLSCIVTVVLVILGTATLARSIGENVVAQNNLGAVQAFWAAEAGANRALYELRSNFVQSGTDLFSGAVGSSGAVYTVDVAANGTTRVATAEGTSPAFLSASVQRRIEVVISQAEPPNFYDHAVYTAGDLVINGNSYTVTGDVRYADDLDAANPGRIDGSIIADESITPLARFDFQQLRDMSAAQGNVYAPDGNKVVNTVTGSEAFPSSFWNTRGDDGVDNDIDGIVDDADEWVPNIVYVECDLQLNGSIGTIGGFFVVVGDIITDPNEADNLTINGRGQIDGVVYTRGEFRVNGGGGTLNVNGGVWAGEEVRLNGNVDVQYNADYMAAIERLNADPAPQIVIWKDLQNPYPLTN